MHATSFLCQLSLISLTIVKTNGAHTRKGVARTDDDLGPTMNVQSPYLVVSANSTFSITCEGYHPIRWNSTFDIETDERAQIYERQITKGYKSTLSIENTVVKDTGKISCYYLRNNTKSNARSTDIYIYVKDPNNLFVPSNKFVGNFGVGSIIEGNEGIIPCRPSDPSVNMTLIKFPSDSQIVHLQEDDIEFDPTQGFIIRFPNIFFNGLFECMASLGDLVERREYHLHYFGIDVKPPHPYIKNKSKALDIQNAKVELKCVAYTKTNNSILLQWSYPNIKNNNLRISNTTEKYIQSANGYSFIKLTSLLHVTNVTSADGGRYSCFSVTSNGKYEEDFTYIPIESVARVVSSNMDGSIWKPEIDDEIKLTCIVDGYPKPNLQWFKNEVLIDETTDRRYTFYDHQFVFVIDEIILSDTGVYSCLAFNYLGNATRNVTVVIQDSSFPKQQLQASKSDSFCIELTIEIFIVNLILILFF